MLVVVKKGSEDNLKKIFDKWDLNCVEIGVVTDTKNLEIYNNGERVANIPSDSLVLGGGAPQYDLPSKEPAYFKDLNKFNIDLLEYSKNYNQDLLTLLKSPNITSKKYVYDQYDSTVRTNTMVGPGSDSAVIRLKETKKALAISTDCNSKYVYLNPNIGAKMAVAEAARNVVCSGAEPLAITNCLNFGNPQDPEIYWQFKESVLGMGEMCRELNTPVTGGNVSFYNETKDGAVYPSPVIGMVGLIDDINNLMTVNFKEKDDLIVVLGSLNGQLGGSEYLKILHNKVEGPISNINISLERKVQETCLEAIKAGLLNSAHDLSDGGLSVSLAESVIMSDSNLGAEINVVRKLEDVELLFGECPSVIVVTLNQDNLYNLVKIAKSHDIHTQTIGKVTDNNHLIINDLISLSKDTLKDCYYNALKEKMSD